MLYLSGITKHLRLISRASISQLSRQNEIQNQKFHSWRIGIPKGAQAALFHRCPGNIAADSTTDYLNDKTNDVHRVFWG